MKTTINIDRIKEIYNEIREFNKLNLSDIEFVDNSGKIIEVEDRIIEDFKYTGLSNRDFIITGFYLEGFKEDKLKIECYYIIGDDDGETSIERNISLNNPYLKTLTSALNKLQYNPFYFDEYEIEEKYNEGLITKDEFDLLFYLTDIDENFNETFISNKSKENLLFLKEFNGLLIDKCELGVCAFNYFETHII